MNNNDHTHCYSTYTSDTNKDAISDLLSAHCGKTNWASSLRQLYALHNRSNTSSNTTNQISILNNCSNFVFRSWLSLSICCSITAWSSIVTSAEIQLDTNIWTNFARFVDKAWITPPNVFFSFNNWCNLQASPLPPTFEKFVQSDLPQSRALISYAMAAYVKNVTNLYKS